MKNFIKNSLPAWTAWSDKALSYKLFNNTADDYLVSLAIILGGALAAFIFRRIILNRVNAWAKRAKIRLNELVIAGIEKPLVPIVYLGLFYAAVARLNLSKTLSKDIDIAAAALLTLFIIRFAIAFLRHSVGLYWRRDEDAVKKQVYEKLFPMAQVVIWLVGVIFLLENLGFRISTLVAGLGLGGVAVALASQALLANFFSYFVILFDKPVELNDFIVLSSEFMGTIEHIGIRTTRVRSLTGELLVLSNSDLTSSRIKNYKTIERRRAQFSVGVSNRTSLDKLQEAPGFIAAIIRGMEEAAFESAYFLSSADSILIIQVVYYVLSSDYRRYMEIQQKINYAIFEECGKRDIEMSLLKSG